MTRDELMALEGRELDVKIANTFFTKAELVPGVGYMQWAPSTCSWSVLPSYSRSLDAARLVEDEIGRRGEDCLNDFCYELRKMLPLKPFVDITWKIRRATPTQICRAALLAVLGGKA